MSAATRYFSFHVDLIDVDFSNCKRGFELRNFGHQQLMRLFIIFFTVSMTLDACYPAPEKLGAIGHTLWPMVEHPYASEITNRVLCFACHGPISSDSSLKVVIWFDRLTSK